MPLTNVSAQEARDYAVWLTERTGFEYRLPSVAEWQFAAEATGTDAQMNDYNCRIQDDSGLNNERNLEDASIGDANSWGIQNYIGNAREFAGSGQGVVANGGSYEDSHDTCDVSLQVPHDGRPDAVTGFRLVRKVGDLLR